MITVKHLEKIYATPAGELRALWPLDFDVKPGDIFGIVGKSGAGKSTLIRCLNLLEKPTQGSVVLGDLELNALNNKELRQARRRMGMIFQHFNLLSSQTVYDNVALPLKFAGYSAEHIRTRVEELLELTGLGDKKTVYPAALSGGQKQRVAIARALANHPDVLLCDEATSALDPQTTQTILNLLSDINQRLGLTIILITHEMDVIKSICTRVALLEQGKIIEQSDVLDFFKNPQTPEAKELVSGCLKQALPNSLKQQLHPVPHEGFYPVLRLIFSGKTATQPLISELVREQGIHVNILQANMEYICEEALGFMVIKVEEAPQGVEKTLDFLRQQHIAVEIIGYVE